MEPELEKLRETVEKHKAVFEQYERYERHRFWAALISVAFTAVFFLDSNFLDHQLLTGIWLVVAVLFGIIILFTMLLAGFAVLKALVHAGAGLTVLMFLGQTYCELEAQSPSGIGALTLILGVGLLYISYQFTTTLLDELKKYHARLGDDKKKSHGIFMTGAVLVFTAIFLWAIFQVISPIVMDLCVYK
jgi:hypothetical protein